MHKNYNSARLGRFSLKAVDVSLLGSPDRAVLPLVALVGLGSPRLLLTSIGALAFAENKDSSLLEIICWGSLLG